MTNTTNLTWTFEQSPLDGVRKVSETVFGEYATVTNTGDGFAWNVWTAASGLHLAGGHAASPEAAVAAAELRLMGPVAPENRR